MPRYRRPGRKVKEPTRPSLFFIIALSVGLLLLALGFWQVATRRTQPAPPPTQQTAVPSGLVLAAGHSCPA